MASFGRPGALGGGYGRLGAPPSGGASAAIFAPSTAPTGYHWEFVTDATNGNQRVSDLTNSNQPVVGVVGN